ncbi:transcription termination factor Rho [Coraliomargarita akajimensis]
MVAPSASSADEIPTSFSTSDEDMIEQNSFATEPTAPEPKADESPAPAASPVQAAEGAPRGRQPRQRGEGGGHKPHGKKPHGGRNQNERQDRQQGRNSKFNKNKKGKGKGRWKNKQKAPRDEGSAIDYGELPEYELFENLDAVRELSVELASSGGEPLDFNRIYDLPIPELRAEVLDGELKIPHAPNREQLLNALLTNAGETKQAIVTTGVLDLLEDEEGGVLVYERDSYRIRGLSAFVPQALIEHYGLQRGHIVRAQLHPHRENETCPFVVSIQSVMGRDPETLSEIVPFTERVPYYPTKRILLETSNDSKWDNLSMRVVDCLTPVGFGQRGLIVAPPRTGKTVLMQGMANAIQQSYPDAHLIVLLIDERPEEVTDFRRQCTGEVISSTFDESAESHVHAAEMVIEKARRMVEVGDDVVILLDSITRLARAYNTMMPNSGKILSGGVEANALQRPKRFFGSARNIEDGGSLTILGTALVETGSKMDEVIFEEFKGTGNMELHLDRGLSDKRIFPALNMEKSGTRKEELLYHPDEMQKIYSLRRAMKGIPSVDAMEMLIQRIKKTKTNAEFLMSVSR